MQPDQVPTDESLPYQPASPQADDTGHIADVQNDHPATDSQLDSDEVYQNGTASAAGVTDPAVSPEIDDSSLDDAL